MTGMIFEYKGCSDFAFSWDIIHHGASVGLWVWRKGVFCGMACERSVPQVKGVAPIIVWRVGRYEKRY